MLDDFGNRLAQARQDGTNAAVNLTLVPDETSAENVQDAANLAYGGTPFGYKIGATSKMAQEMLAAPGPFFGVMVDIDRYDDGETIPWKDHFRGVECEFAFRMGADYPHPGEDVSRDRLIAAIGGCHIALELVGRRTAGEGMPKYPGIIADYGAHAAFVMGAEIPGWLDAGLEDLTVKGLLNGAVTNEGTGAAVMGHPLNSLQWLAERFAERGRKLEAGDIVTTGTTLGIIPVEPGGTVKGEFGPHGTIALVFGPV